MAWDSDGQDGSSDGVYVQLFNENATRIGNELQVNTYTNNSQYFPSVASFSGNNFVVTWSSVGQDGSGLGIYGQLFYGNATRIGNEFQVNTYITTNQYHSSVTCFSNENFVVAWNSEGQDGSSKGIYGQLFDGNANRIGREFQVNTYTDDNQEKPSVASFDNENFVVAWNSEGQDGSSYGIYGQLFDENGTKIENEFQVNTYIANMQWGSFAASFRNGNFIVTWHSEGQDGSGWGIYGQLFDGNATKIGNEFQINMYITGVQARSSAACFSNGNFIVTWHSDGQDGSGYGIYGQLFEGPLITSSTTSSSSEMPTSSSIISSA